MLSLTGKFQAKGQWKLDPLNGPASIPNEPDGPPAEVPSFTVTQDAFVNAGTANGDRMGFSLGVSDNVAILGSPYFSNMTGKAQIFEYNGTSWTLALSLSPISPSGQPNYGIATATNGTWVAVGGHQAAGGTGLGFVNLYKKSGSWSNTPTQVLSPSVVSGQNFGFSTAMTATTLVAGAQLDTVSSQPVGQVYVYTVSSDVWSLQATLNAGAYQAAGSHFGASVSISGDTMVVGAPAESSNAGAVYVFTRSGSTWTLRARLVPASPIANSLFGISVRTNGSRIVVGASGWSNDQANVGANSAVYVFDGSGATWTETQVLTVSTTTGSTLVDANYGGGAIGQSVDLSADGKVIITGGWRATTTKALGGAVYVFELANGVWGPSAIANSSSSLRLSTSGAGTAAEYFGFQTKFHGNAVFATVPYRNLTAISTQRGGFGYFK